MRDLLKNWAKPIAMVALIGLPLVGVLLLLATQKGETQAGREPKEEMKPALLQVSYRSERNYQDNWQAKSHTFTRTEVEQKSLDATIRFEFPEGVYQMEEAACEALETQIRQLERELTREKNEAIVRATKQALREMEKAARECRQNIPLYGFLWDRGPISALGPFRLVSFSSHANYSLEEKVLEKGVELCTIAGPAKNYEHTYVKTVQGTDSLGTPIGESIPPPLPLTSRAIFAVGVKGDKLTHLSVGDHWFNATGSETTTHKGCESKTDKRSIEQSINLTMGFPVTYMGPDPEWSVQVARTADGYTGSASYRKTITDGKSTTVETKTMTFTFQIGEAVYEVIVEPPKNLKDWIPKGGENENSAGDQLKFTGQVQEKKGSKGGGSRKVKVVFELTSSREPGIAMNFPPKELVSKPPHPDLRILKDGTSSAFKITEETREDGLGEYKAEGEFKVGESFTVVVGSFDYGAYGYLNVSADAPVRIEDYPDTNRVWLPKDDNMNSIADKWEEGDKGVRGRASDSDEDSKPEGDETPGDGLSLYEEYRGFMVQGNHIRTNPKYKDLFIFDLNKMGPGHFKKSGLRLHFVKLTEYDEDPASQTPNTAVINYNHGHSNLGKQHLLFLMDGDGIGRTGYSLGGGPPKDIKYVLVDLNAHKQMSKGELSATIAHELAHASNIEHHGNCDYEVEKVELQDPNGRWITVSFGHITIGVRGGQNSGPICIMKYNDANYYEKPNGRFRWEKEAGKGFGYGERYPRGEAMGTIFCNTKRGVGVTGNATYGECKKQFCVNDTRPCRKLPDVECR